MKVLGKPLTLDTDASFEINTIKIGNRTLTKSIVRQIAVKPPFIGYVSDWNKENLICFPSGYVFCAIDADNFSGYSVSQELANYINTLWERESDDYHAPEDDPLAILFPDLEGSLRPLNYLGWVLVDNDKWGLYTVAGSVYKFPLYNEPNFINFISRTLQASGFTDESIDTEPERIMEAMYRDNDPKPLNADESRLFERFVSWINNPANQVFCLT